MKTPRLKILSVETCGERTMVDVKYTVVCMRFAIFVRSTNETFACSKIQIASDTCMSFLFMIGNSKNCKIDTNYSHY